LHGLDHYLSNSPSLKSCLTILPKFDTKGQALDLHTQQHAFGRSLTTNILLVSAGFFHPPWLGRFWLRQTLQALPGVHLQRVATLEALPASDPHKFQAIVLYIHQQKLSLTALDALDHFVSRGGGLLAIHSATASFKHESRYYNILGGRFTGHGPLCKLQICPARASDEVFPGIGTFPLYEEPYEHEMDPACKVHFYAQDAQSPVAARCLPAVWTYHHGQGRVCYCLPGHRSAAMHHPVVREILQSGLSWVCQRIADGKTSQ